jgi:mono/diheme cytochrome c family protein
MESLQKNKKRKNIVSVVALISLSLSVIGSSLVLHAADDSSGKPESADEKPTSEECCKPGDTTPPIELAKKIPPGGLHSPYPDYAKLAKDEELVKQFRLPGCNECHGGTGGGGFCPALSQGVWFWGNTDDVLFRLISLGSADLEKQGFTRIQWGTVHAGMPMMGHTIKTADHLWKIIAFIRSINPPGTNPPEKLVAPRMHPIGEEGAASH